MRGGKSRTISIVNELDPTKVTDSEAWKKWGESIPLLVEETAGTTIRPAPAKAARERIRFVSRRELEDLRGEGGRLLSFEERPAWAWDPKALLLLVEDRGGNHSKRERKRAMLPKLLQLFERLALEEPCLGLDEDSCRNCAGRGVLDGGECGRCGGSGKRGFDTCSACGGSGGGDEPELRCRRCGGSGEELPF